MHVNILLSRPEMGFSETSNDKTDTMNTAILRNI